MTNSTPRDIPERSESWYSDKHLDKQMSIKARKRRDDPHVHQLTNGWAAGVLWGLEGHPVTGRNEAPVHATVFRTLEHTLREKSPTPRCPSREVPRIRKSPETENRLMVIRGWEGEGTLTVWGFLLGWWKYSRLLWCPRCWRYNAVIVLNTTDGYFYVMENSP